VRWGKGTIVCVLQRINSAEVGASSYPEAEGGRRKKCIKMSEQTRTGGGVVTLLNGTIDAPLEKEKAGTEIKVKNECGKSCKWGK